jgi:TRAP-type C4-dicarboxylate transport system permease small subunit
LAQGFRRALDKFCDTVNRASEIAIGMLTAATVAVTFVQVVCRYALDSSLSWSEEFSRYAFIWAIFLGAGSVTRRGQHMAVDALRNALPRRPRHVLEIFIAVTGLMFFAVFGYTAMLLVDNAMGQISTALQIPIAIVYASAPVGVALTVLHLANGIVQGAAGRTPASKPDIILLSGG